MGPTLSLVFVLMLFLHLNGHVVGEKTTWFRHIDGITHCVLLNNPSGVHADVSMLQCSAKCVWDDGCFSFSYSDPQRRCELTGASGVLLPPVPEGSFVTFHHTSQEGVVLGRLSVIKTKGLPSPGLTGNTFDTQALAAAECGGLLHLCELWEIQAIVGEGNTVELPENTDMWYAVADSQAVVAGVDVAQHGLPMVKPSPGVCCPGRQLEPKDPIVTTESFSRNDREAQAGACTALAAHPCTLAELKAAHVRGFSMNDWSYFAKPGRDDKLHSGSNGCGSYSLKPNECYEGTVANTPRPYASGSVVCCPNIYGA